MVKANTKETIKGRNRKILIGIGVFAVVYIVSLFVPIISNFTKYPIYVVKCGGQPVIVTDLAGKGYILPGNKVYGPSVFMSGYYCTEQEAIDRHYQKND